MQVTEVTPTLPFNKNLDKVPDFMIPERWPRKRLVFEYDVIYFVTKLEIDYRMKVGYTSYASRSVTSFRSYNAHNNHLWRWVKVNPGLNTRAIESFIHFYSYICGYKTVMNEEGEEIFIYREFVKYSSVIVDELISIICEINRNGKYEKDGIMFSFLSKEGLTAHLKWVEYRAYMKNQE